jgi:quinolinate synthase
MLHQLRKANPEADFQAVNPKADCKYMKMITPEKLLRSLRENVYEVTVDPQMAAKARRAVERMVELGGAPVPA